MPRQTVGHKRTASDSTTVTFNVGGKLYQVSRSLLDRYPLTMLSRMASETWQTTDAAAEKIIFIERDGERFRYVLDYMRDAEVSLPGGQGGVTKTSLFKELLYYGFHDFSMEDIKVEITHLEAPKYLAQLTKEHKEELEVRIQERTDLSLVISASVVAYATCIRFMTLGNPSVEFAIVNREGVELKRHAENALDYEVTDAINKYGGLESSFMVLLSGLERYGLHCSDYSEIRNLSGQPRDVCTSVKLKVYAMLSTRK